MSDTPDTDLPGGWEAAAAEYVLGLMPEDERRSFESRMAADPDLRQDVAAWAEFFATLTDGIAEKAPPPQILRRIESTLFVERRKPLWQQLLPYVMGAVAGAALAWVAFTTDLLDVPSAMLVAELAPVEGEIALTARFDAETAVLSVERVAGAVPDDRVLELWLIAEEGGPPVSLGLLRGTRGTVLALPPLLAERLPGATLAVSEEPPGGSPTGAPTGPVRAAGQLVAL